MILNEEKIRELQNQHEDTGESYCLCGRFLPCLILDLVATVEEMQQKNSKIVKASNSLAKLVQYMLPWLNKHNHKKIVAALRDLQPLCCAGEQPKPETCKVLVGGIFTCGGPLPCAEPGHEEGR